MDYSGAFTHFFHEFIVPDPHRYKDFENKTFIFTDDVWRIAHIYVNPDPAFLPHAEGEFDSGLIDGNTVYFDIVAETIFDD